MTIGPASINEGVSADSLQRLAAVLNSIARVVFALSLLTYVPIALDLIRSNSWRASAYVLIPIGTLHILQAAVLCSSAVRAEMRGRCGRFTWLWLAAVDAALFIWLSRVPHAPSEAYAILVVIGASVLAGVVMGRLSAYLTYIFITTLISIVFTLEWCPRVLNWQDYFLYMFPTEPPFIGPGGRLRPSVCGRLQSPFHPFGVRMRTNRLGFRNSYEVDDKIMARDTIRILSLGDSFSTGYACDQERFFGSVLEKTVRAMMGGEVVVLNAEVSDPAYGLYYLSKFGANYQPHLVLYGLCGNDALQAFYATSDRGVFHVTKEGRISARPGRKRGYDYASDWKDFCVGQIPASDMSYLNRIKGRLRGVVASFQKLRVFKALALLAAPVDRTKGELCPAQYTGVFERADGRKRLIDGFENPGFFYRDSLAPVEELHEILRHHLRGLRNEARAVGAQFVLIYYPQRFQVRSQDWKIRVQAWNLDPGMFDLDLWNRRLAHTCAEESIPFIDLTQAFRDASAKENLFLPGDWHFTERGEALAAERVSEWIVSGLRRAASDPATGSWIGQ